MAAQRSPPMLFATPSPPALPPQLRVLGGCPKQRGHMAATKCRPETNKMIASAFLDLMLPSALAPRRPPWHAAGGAPLLKPCLT